MFDRKHSCWLALLLLASACANRRDGRARDAFDAARGRGANRRGDKSEVVAGGGRGVFDREKIGWDRVRAVLDHAVEAMRASPSDAELGGLAQRWCDAEPETEDTGLGPVHTCDPEPPIVAEGMHFQLEMGGGGVIGLVARDLSAADSIQIAEQARSATKGLCVEPWRDTTASRGPKGGFAWCPAEGGPLLSVSRFPREPASDRWLVSVAVLSPG